MASSGIRKVAHRLWIWIGILTLILWDVWGGEGLLGIDCSGLARQGLIWGQLAYGVRTLNGTPIRNALWLWWNDCSALALRDGFKGATHEYFRADGIANADEGRLKPGDLAVTADGVHVLIYLGDRAWIEADPAAHKVLEIDLRTDNPWLHVPVVFVRWKCLDLPFTTS
jgi:cell wall-associated NlpC family hydrolase